MKSDSGTQRHYDSEYYDCDLATSVLIGQMCTKRSKTLQIKINQWPEKMKAATLFIEIMLLV